MIRRIWQNVRRIRQNVKNRTRLYRGVVALYNEGMCRHVHARIVAPDTADGLVDPAQLRVEYVHTCGDACPWLEGRRIVDEQIGQSGAW